jgi:hypothetical protein
VFAAVTNRDNSNLMAAQIARATFKVPVVLVRIYDPVRGEIYRELGLETISPTTIIADLFYERIVKQLGSQPPAPAAAIAPPAAQATTQPQSAPQPPPRPMPQPAAQPNPLDPTKGGNR